MVAHRRRFDGLFMALHTSDFDAYQQGAGSTQYLSERGQTVNYRAGRESFEQDFIMGEEAQRKNRDISFGSRGFLCS